MSPATPAPLANYPQVRRSGSQLYVSGMSARTVDGIAGVSVLPDGSKRYDIALQTTVVIDKIQAALLLAGASLDNCVSLTCYLADMRDYAAFNEVYNQRFSLVHGPARTCVSVLSLPHPDMRVEITATAEVPVVL